MKKIIITFTLAILIFLTYNLYTVDAGIADDLGMSGVMTPATSDGGIGGAINSVIGLIQFAGTGIALVTITVLGIKYILASPSEKADVKKAIMPIIIGCILLFGAVNIVAMMANFTNSTLSN